MFSEFHDIKLHFIFCILFCELYFCAVTLTTKNEFGYNIAIKKMVLFAKN
jgi:hypothetical protein